MYICTRGMGESSTASQAIIAGMSGDGGLFDPSVIPRINTQFFEQLVSLKYRQRAVKILQYFLDDFNQEELISSVQAAYNDEKFSSLAIAPVVRVGDIFVLELWHGPTLAFKDMALQLLPQLMAKALVKTGVSDEIVILVATSGDTGKAALEGFKDVQQTRIIVFFPHQGVSEIQQLQMVTQDGSNVTVIAVKGNFDDTQTGVKKIFGNLPLNHQLNQGGIRLSSANSINWGRLVPQIVYYFSAYADLIKKEGLVAGQPVNFVVPTGNFGNILAGYYAKEMGLPVNKLICASNSNNILTEFIRTGQYNRNRDFYKTISPSMDILISSNLERLLFHVSGGHAAAVRQWMNDLNAKATYTVNPDCLAAIQSVFWADWADERQTSQRIQSVYSSRQSLLDPHTAVAWEVYDSYVRSTGDATPTVIVSTASPFKFNESVLAAIKRQNLREVPGGFAALAELSAATGWTVPGQLQALQYKEIRHNYVCGKDEMESIVRQTLGAE